MSAPTTGTTPKKDAPSPGRIITAACVGNALEWYDIAVYSYFATYLSKVFFADDDPALSLFLTLGTFGVSFLIRPVGALVLGSYADRAGRKAALTWSIGLMAVGTLMICVMPSYAAIGAVAPVGILVARLVQGFAAGGEFGSATALMVEHMPNRRGFAASWQFTSQAASTLLAALLGTVLTSTLSEEQLGSWGFRIPFAVGLLVAPVGLYIRRNVPEPSATRDTEPAHAPVRTLLREHKAGVLLTIGLLAVTTCLNYLITYIPTYATKTLGLPDSTGFVAALAGGLVLLAVTSVAGHFSDRVGQIALMVPAAGAVLLLIYPMFALLVSAPSLALLIGVVMVMALCKACYYGPMGALMAGIFPTGTRATGMAVGYNIGVTVFGGFTPMIAAWLLDVTGQQAAPAYWVALAAVASLSSLFVLRRRATRPR
ncbi:MFS transporter [Streptomyces sp. NPDC006422]|uniref:MFS transporter n=1 Tax=unclassified Streptomyces TaxID=2593676 RepID=UPI0033AF6308